MAITEVYEPLLEDVVTRAKPLAQDQEAETAAGIGLVGSHAHPPFPFVGHYV
jgi:hypothetical protein